MGLRDHRALSPLFSRVRRNRVEREKKSGIGGSEPHDTPSPRLRRLSEKNLLAAMTDARCTRNNFNSSCADLIRVSTSLFRPAQGMDGRPKPGQDKIGEATSLPWLPQTFSGQSCASGAR